MRTCIKSRTSSNFDQIGQLTTELAALECLKISHRLIMGKWCLHASSFIFDQIIIKVAGNQDRHIKARMSLISGLWFPWPIYVFEMRFDLSTLDSGERSLPFGLLFFWSDSSSTCIFHVCEQRRLWRVCVNSQARQSLLIIIMSWLNYFLVTSFII